MHAAPCTPLRVDAHPDVGGCDATQELSDELRRLKARLNPMGPPPARPPQRGDQTAAQLAAPPAAAMAAATASEALPRPIHQCDPTYSPVGRAAAGTLQAGTPATQLGPSSVPNALSMAQSTGPPTVAIEPLDPNASGPPVGIAYPPSNVSVLTPGNKNAALSGLEESQRHLEEKLAVLKKKLEAEAT